MDHQFKGPPYTVGIEEELMILDAESLELVNAIESMIEPAPSGEIKPELMESVLEISTDPCANLTEAGSSCAPCAPGRPDRRLQGPRDRVRRHAPVRDVGGPADRGEVALPRAGLGAGVRRPPGADLRSARARRHRRPRQGDPRRQRDARTRTAAARPVGQLAVLARRLDGAGLGADPDLQGVPADGNPAHLRELGGLRAADRVHGQSARDRGLHVPVARRAPASRASARWRSG